MSQKEMLFWNSLAFSMIQRMLAICSLVPLPFLNPAALNMSTNLENSAVAKGQEQVSFHSNPKEG